MENPRFIGTEQDLKEATPVMVEGYELLWGLSERFMQLGFVEQAAYFVTEATEVANRHLLMVVDIKGVKNE